VGWRIRADAQCGNAGCYGGAVRAASLKRGTVEAPRLSQSFFSCLLAGEFNKPDRIVAFNTAEGCSRDMTVDIADELRRRFVEFDEVRKRSLPSWKPINVAEGG
jgi:hypothetical protein